MNATVATRKRRRRIQRVQVRVEAGPDVGASLKLGTGDVRAIGTATDNELVLTDPKVSRYHVEVTATLHGLALRDLGSTNGTHVNGVRLGDGQIAPGTALRIGGSTLRVLAGDEAIVESEADDDAIEGIVGASEPMVEVRRMVRRLGPSNVGILVHGETGTGKERIAEAIHEASSRKDGPFIIVDCGSLPATLVSSELFGHERGAFTGAVDQRIGAFERARGGTIFLDEIGELPMAVQASLLGILERKKFLRVGGSAPIETDARVVSATHRDLRSAVNGGQFRADLYFRLAGARIAVPALRERAEDIPALVEHFVTVLTGGLDASPFGEAAMRALAEHRWSGNVRELRNVVEHSIALGALHLERTGEVAARAEEGATSPSIDVRRPYKEARAVALGAFERAYLRSLIEACSGNASEAARRARIDRGYLLSLLRRHGLR